MHWGGRRPFLYDTQQTMLWPGVGFGVFVSNVHRIWDSCRLVTPPEVQE